MRVFSTFVVCAGLIACQMAAFAEPSYDDLKRDLSPREVGSPTQLRKNLDAMDGQAVEMQGEISGIMVRPEGKLIMLKMGDDMALLTAPVNKNEPLLRAGTQIRIIGKVDANSKDGAVAIMAVSRAVAEAESASPETLKKDESDLSLPQPPEAVFVTSTPAPRAQPKPQSKPLAARGGEPKSGPVAPAKIAKPQVVPSGAGAPPPVASYEVDTIVDQQRASYAAIVRKHNKRLRPAVVNEIAEAVLRAGYKYSMDPRFLAAIIAVESDFDVNCLSSSGAMGLGQLMPFNLKEAGVRDPWNPTQNIFGTAKLLRGHLNDFKSRPNGTLLAVAAYNAGPNAVKRAGYKVPNGAQVQRYVWKVYYRYKAFAPDMF